MIISEKLSWYHFAFRIKGGPLPNVWVRLFLVTGFSIIITISYTLYGIQEIIIPNFPFNVIGIALAIFFGFRNNAAYDRYWEARIQWGELYNACRNLTTQIISLVPACPIENEEELSYNIKYEHWKTSRLIIAYAYSLKDLLRGESKTDYSAYLDDNEQRIIIKPGINIPTQLLLHLGLKFKFFTKNEWCHPLHVNVLHENITKITQIQGACERIKTTPVPFAYKTLIHSITGMYCFILSFALVPALGLLTPLIVCFVSYTFLALDHIGDEIEEPFGLDPNDLPLNAFTTKIEASILQQFGEDYEAHTDNINLEIID